MVASLALLALLVTATPGRAAERIWLEVKAPHEKGHVRGPVGLVEVRGWAGTGIRGKHDVIVAVDRSSSVWKASGIDVDGDGVIGRPRRGGLGETIDRTTDPGDTVFRAELMAARRLVERLDPATSRIGILSFTDHARLRAPLGSSRDTLQRTLSELPDPPASAGTSFYWAILDALQAFRDAPAKDGPKRLRSLVLLSDGAPTRPPPPDKAARFALHAAREAAREGVRIYAFGLGPDAISSPAIFSRIARITQGELLLVDHPADVIEQVPYLSLTKLTGVEIDNLSMSQSARAIRLLPDGSFDGYAPLRPGANIVRVRVRTADSERFVDRRIFFEKIEPRTREEVAAADALLKRLELRTLEAQLAAEVRVKRARLRARTRELEVVVEE
ncbi:MAG: VWA domain-containing protein [Myxococcota bacterium]